MSKEEWLKQKAEKDKAKTEKEEEARRKAEAAKQAKAAQQAAEAKRLADEQAAKAASKPAATANPQTPKEELPPLPAAVADWKDYDFFLARVTGDPMLIPAVKYVAEHRIGDANAARLLGRLLQPRTLAELRDKFIGSGSRRKPGEQSGQAALIEAIVAALAANDTDVAQQFLRMLVTGEFETEDDKTAAYAALKVLAERPGPANDATLYHLLVSPDDVRLPGRGGVTSQDLRSRALSLLASNASVSLRLKLARALTEGRVAEPLRPSLESLVLAPNPANLEAQIAIYQASLPRESANRGTIEGLFHRYSSQAMGYFLGLPGQSMPEATQADLPSRVAEWLWGPRFQTLLEVRLTQLDALADGSQATLFAGTVPADAMRACLFRLLDRRWHEGTSVLEPWLSGNGSTCEPGLLPILKMVDRENHPETPRSSRRMTSAELKKVSEVMEKRREIETEWSDAVEQLLETQCERFEAASVEQAIARGNGYPSVSQHRAKLDLIPAGLPVELHPSTEIVAFYSLDWPNVRVGSGDALPTDRMSLRYVRLRGEVMPSTLHGFFRRQLPSCEEHELSHGLWFDDLRKTADPGRQESVDVKVVVVDPDRPALPDEVQPLIVDILSITIRDPRPQAEAQPEPGRTEADSVGTSRMPSGTVGYRPFASPNGGS